MNSDIEKGMERAGKEVERLFETYDSAEALLGDALKGAMVWVPGYMGKKSLPSASQLFTLGTQLLAIAIATERSKGRKTGYV